jgi:hypothetical protein
MVDDAAFVAELVMSKSSGLSLLDSDDALAPLAAVILLPPVVAMAPFSGGLLPTQVSSDLFILQLYIFHT